MSLAVGDDASALIMRRAFALRSVTATGTFGGTIEVVVDPDADAGSAWIAGRRLHDEVSVLGPFGRGFPLPTQPTQAIVAGVGVSAASLVWLITELRRAGCQVPSVIVGAPEARRLLGVIEARRLVGNVVTVVRDDATGSFEYALQTALDRALHISQAPLVYAAGDVSSLAALTAAAQGRGAVLQGAFSVSMPCGTGLCRACTIPVADASGEVRTVRCCTEGPVLPADRVAWAPLLDQLSARGGHG